MKRLLLILVLVVVTGTGCGMLDRFDHIGKMTLSTPYDIKYHKIKMVLRAIKVRDKPDSETLKQIERYDRQARGWITYKHEGNKDRWQLPQESQRLRTGDCEDMAIWVYAKMLENGMTNVRMMVGQYKGYGDTRHAWLNWYYKGDIYIIDPTMSAYILKVSDHPPGYYKPLYSFNLKSKWYHVKRKERDVI